MQKGAKNIWKMKMLDNIPRNCGSSYLDICDSFLKGKCLLSYIYMLTCSLGFNRQQKKYQNLSNNK